MLSTEECKKHLGDTLTDQQIENLRDALYALVENVLDDYISSCAMIEPCKKLSSIAEYLPSDKKTKVMA